LPGTSDVWSALGKIEDAQRRPSAQIAELIAKRLNIPPEKHSNFVKVARGELSVDYLTPTPKPPPNIPPASTPRVNLPVLPTPLSLLKKY
jgi:hypothetical protein